MLQEMADLISLIFLIRNGNVQNEFHGMFKEHFNADNRLSCGESEDESNGEREDNDDRE